MNKKFYPWIISGVVVAVVLVAFATFKENPSPVVIDNDQAEERDVVLGEDFFRPEDPDALATVEGGTRRVLAKKIETPGPGDKPDDPNIAVPMSVTKLGILERRIFELKGENQRYSPSIVVVNDGDIIIIDFTSVDSDYDIFFPDFGFYRFVSRGETERVQFQTTSYGEYDFYCRDACNRDVRGKLIINE